MSDGPLPPGDEPVVPGDEPMVPGDEPMVPGDEPMVPGFQSFASGAELFTPSAESIPTSYELELLDGSLETLSARGDLALIGPGALACAHAFAVEHAAAVLLADADDPLHSGWALDEQIADALAGSRRAARDRATDLLELTGMPEPHLKVHARPHELSALDRQRAQLALVLANAPALVVGEDPCAGLEPTEAATFAATLHRLWGRFGFTLLIACREPADARRAAEQMLVLAEDGSVSERRRRRHAD